LDAPKLVGIDERRPVARALRKLFSRVTSEQLAYLAAIAREVEVPAGRRFYSESDPPDGLYIVVSGSVIMPRAGTEFARVGPNGAFGAWALLDEEPRLTTAASAEESGLLFIARDDFYDVLSDHVDIVARLFQHLVRRLRRLPSVVEKLSAAPYDVG